MESSNPPPSRRRPALRLNTGQMSSPLHRTRSYAAVNSSPGHTPLIQTPIAYAPFSPFRSASFTTPSPYRTSAPFKIRRTRSNLYGAGNLWWKTKQLLCSRTFLFLAVFLTLIYWWWAIQDGSLDWETLQEKLMKDLWHDSTTNGMQFFPANSPKLHYMGRWTATKNRMRRDGAFPGAYFDIKVNGTERVYLELGNEGERTKKAREKYRKAEEQLQAWAHLEFQERPGEEPNKPISILSRVDEEEYVLLPKSAHLVSLISGKLDARTPHDIRVIVPMVDDEATIAAQVVGIWLDKSGSLLRVEGSSVDNPSTDENPEEAGADRIRVTHHITTDKDDERGEIGVERKKVIEIVTDSPSRSKPDHLRHRHGGVHGLLAGVMGWEFLLGEMFGIDHATTAVDGMCLTQECIGGTAAPVSMPDIFFRSGPVNSSQFRHPWMFSLYVPDVLILDLGSSDFRSFKRHVDEYNNTAGEWGLHTRFEDSYVSFVQSIRKLAYPKHPSVIYDAAHHGNGYYQYAERIAPASIPIFVMRPLRGEMEHATQNAVNRLRQDGDRFVFWIDTSGWLDKEDATSDDADWYVDKLEGQNARANGEQWSPEATRYRLTERGSQRVAIFLHMHVCSYLAEDGEQCAFLPREVYEGRAFEPEKEAFDRYVEEEKKKKLKKVFDLARA